jgi:hypothetical protein
MLQSWPSLSEIPSWHVFFGCLQDRIDSCLFLLRGMRPATFGELWHAMLVELMILLRVNLFGGYDPLCGIPLFLL